MVFSPSSFTRSFFHIVRSRRLSSLSLFPPPHIPPVPLCLTYYPTLLAHARQCTKYLSLETGAQSLAQCNFAEVCCFICRQQDISTLSTDSGSSRVVSHRIVSAVVRDHCIRSPHITLSSIVHCLSRSVERDGTRPAKSTKRRALISPRRLPPPTMSVRPASTTRTWRA